MRQIGRYMKEYRDLRSNVGFLELCKRPDLVCEATVTAVNKIGADAAIIFADILLITEPMGFQLEFSQGDGPVIHNPFSNSADLKRLRDPNPKETLKFVPDAIRLVRKELRPDIPVIGFAGAPYTVASYIIEGGSSKNFAKTKALMRSDPDTWNRLLSHIARGTASYLQAQIDAGAETVQLFDSWVGSLSPEDYRTYVLPHSKTIFDALPSEFPTIHFGAGSGLLLEAMKEAGGSVIGVDFRISIADARKRLGDISVQGNLDPTVLLCPRDVIQKEAKKVLENAGTVGHIFNLGHGILPNTPEDNVRFLIDFVHETSAR